MKQSILALATIALVAACAPATPEAAAPSDAAAPAATSAEALATPAPAEPTAGADSPAAGVQTFVIDPGQSQVIYEVGETFFREGNRFNVAVGTTNTLNGEVMLDYDQPSRSTVGPLTVDISQFASDSERRDERIREEWLESAKFPLVTFTPTGATGLTDDAQEGSEYTFQVTGDTTIRDTTKPLTFTVTATLNADTLTGTATTGFNMTDFGFQPPDIAGMLKSEDAVKIRVEFVATPK